MRRLITRPGRQPLPSPFSHVYPKTSDYLRFPPRARQDSINPSPLSTSSSSSGNFRPKSIYFYTAAAGALTSGLALMAYYLNSPPLTDDPTQSTFNQLYVDLDQTLQKYRGSIHRVMNQMVQTGAAASVLWKSLASVLSSANQEVRSGFELRVAALLADIAAASEARRASIVGAGGGAVVDWLLETVAAPLNGGDRGGTQAESARALAYLIADPHVCDKVLGRPNAIPHLLRFIFSFQPKRQKKARFMNLLVFM